MAILQQQRQQQGGGTTAGGGNSKLSPSHLGGGLSKQPMGDPLPHSGMGGALSDLHAKTQGMYSGRYSGHIISSQHINILLIYTKRKPLVKINVPFAFCPHVRMNLGL